MSDVQEKFISGIKIQREKVMMISFADDIVILAGKQEDFRNGQTRMDNLLTKKFGMKSNKS